MKRRSILISITMSEAAALIRGLEALLVGLTYFGPNTSAVKRVLDKTRAAVAAAERASS